MNSRNVCYIAGTQANYWNWCTGTFIVGTGTSKYPFEMSYSMDSLFSKREIVNAENMPRPTLENNYCF